MSRLSNYLRDTIAEMKHVSWPTQKQALVYSALVIGISVFVAVFVGGVDYVFTTIFNIIVL